MIKLTCLANNCTRQRGVVACPGNALFISLLRHNILLNCGPDTTVVRNAEQLEVDLSSLDAVMLSCGLLDFSGGLEEILKVQRQPLRVFAHPEVFSRRYQVTEKAEFLNVSIPHDKSYYRKMRMMFKPCQGARQILPNCFTTGEVPRKVEFEDIHEILLRPRGRGYQADQVADDIGFFFTTEGGPVVIIPTGFAGITNTLQRVASVSKTQEFRALVANFTTAARSEERLARTLQELKGFQIQRLFSLGWISPQAEYLLYRQYKESYEAVGAGDALRFEL